VSPVCTPGTRNPTAGTTTEGLLASVMPGHKVIGGVGLSGLEPLTSALSGEPGGRPMAHFTLEQGPAWSTVVGWHLARSSSSLTSRGPAHRGTAGQRSV
jgi:hypothetical protein